MNALLELVSFNEPYKPLNIVTGVTGNKYILGFSKDLVKWACQMIDKSPNSVYYSKKYDCWAARIKSKYHKRKLEESNDIF